MCTAVNRRPWRSQRLFTKWILRVITAPTCRFERGVALLLVKRQLSIPLLGCSLRQVRLKPPQLQPAHCADGCRRVRRGCMQGGGGRAAGMAANARGTAAGRPATTWPAQITAFERTYDDDQQRQHDVSERHVGRRGTAMSTGANHCRRRWRALGRCRVASDDRYGPPWISDAAGSKAGNPYARRRFPAAAGSALAGCASLDDF